MIDKSVSVSVIFIANISVIGISVILHIGAPLPQIIKIIFKIKEYSLQYCVHAYVHLPGAPFAFKYLSRFTEFPNLL